MRTPTRLASLHATACAFSIFLPLLLLGQAAPPSANPGTSANPGASAAGQNQQTIQLEPFEVVSDKGTRGYATTNALGATRINAPIADTPQAVVSLNQEFLKDINPTNLADALRFVSGVNKSAGEYGGEVTIRGITTEAIGFRDSIRDRLSTAAAGLAALPDPIEVERLEVIKGPAGVLYGSHGFGGVINRVSKRPLSTRQTEIGAEYTVYDNDEAYYRGTLDSTGPVDAGGKLRYRLLGAYQDGENHMHGRYLKSTAIGTVEYQPNQNTAVWLRGRYSDDGTFFAQDLWTDVARNMPFGFLPRNAYVGNFYNDDQVDSVRAEAYELGATHSLEALGTRWSARLLGRYNDVVGQRRTYISSGSFFYRSGVPLRLGNADMSTNNATWAQAVAAGYDDIRENIQRRDLRNADSQEYSWNFDLTGKLTLGPTLNNILLYGGMSDDETFSRRYRENWIAAKPSVFHMTSVPPEQVLDNNPQTLANEWSTTNSYRHYFAVQDNIGLFEDRLILVGAARYDSGTTRVFDHRANVRLPAEKSTNWTPTYGLVGKPLAGVSVFLLHSETFQPQGGVNQAGERLRPLIGDNNEFGVKLDLWRNRLVLTGSYFDMEQENAFLKVIYPDGSFDFQQVPSSETKGWELDLAAQPIDNLSLLVAYQWIEAKTQNGLSVRDVPQGGTYKFVGKYSIPRGALKGLDLGVTHEYVNDNRAGDAANNFFTPGYDLTGLFAAYRWKAWRFQINVENVTDEWYIAGSTAQQFMRSGPPRYYKFSTRYSF
jgi:iron complex outermembrane recepter protein